MEILSKFFLQRANFEIKGGLCDIKIHNLNQLDILSTNRVLERVPKLNITYSHPKPTKPIYIDEIVKKLNELGIWHYVEEFYLGGSYIDLSPTIKSIDMNASPGLSNEILKEIHLSKCSKKAALYIATLCSNLMTVNIISSEMDTEDCQKAFFKEVELPSLKLSQHESHLEVKRIAPKRYSVISYDAPSNRYCHVALSNASIASSKFYFSSFDNTVPLSDRRRSNAPSITSSTYSKYSDAQAE